MVLAHLIKQIVTSPAILQTNFNIPAVFCNIQKCLSLKRNLLHFLSKSSRLISRDSINQHGNAAKKNNSSSIFYKTI